MSENVNAEKSPFHSKFGGMWIDRADFPEQLKLRVSTGALDDQSAAQISDFERDGYIVLEGAASESDLDRFEAAISRAFLHGDDQVIGQQHGSSVPKRITAGLDRREVRIVDAFAVIPEAQHLLASPPILSFMTKIFDERPLLFQSMSFDMGSQQGLHQDTAYVVVERPMELLACWIALEDVRPGSGELQYLVGGHRLPDFDFGGHKKHWDSATDGNEPHNIWAKWLIDESDRRGMRREKFMAKRGDVLIWHADLPHGGSPITDPTLTRKSLVGHYCPLSAKPHYMKFMPPRTAIKDHGGLAYASGHYDLAAIESLDSRAEFLRNLFAQEGT